MAVQLLSIYYCFLISRHYSSLCCTPIELYFALLRSTIYAYKPRTFFAGGGNRVCVKPETLGSPDYDQHRVLSTHAGASKTRQKVGPRHVCQPSYITSDVSLYYGSVVWRGLAKSPPLTCLSQAVCYSVSLVSIYSQRNLNSSHTRQV